MQTTKVTIDQQAERDKYTELIINSPAQKRIIVAGPGTGKTTTFQKVLAQTDSKNNLVLTFINRLVNDLNGRLNQYANVSTMHKFCAGIFHKQFPEWHLVGSLGKIIAEDTKVCLGIYDEVFHKLDESSSMFKLYLKRGSYYKSVGFNDSVYRVLKKGLAAPDIIAEYDNILIDEFQDFSALEAAFIKLLEAHGKILIVGDDDQAIYLKRFDLGRNLRSMYRSGDYSLFELPYCSRCPKVIVESVNDIVNSAVNKGYLKDRISKQFVAYEPEKEEVNRNYPKLLVLEMVSDKAAALFVDRYVCHILKNELERYQQSQSTDPLVLIIGKPQCLNSVKKKLPTIAEYIEPDNKSTELTDICRAYDILMKDDSSNMGWRLLMLYDKIPSPKKHKEIISKSMDGSPLVSFLPGEYKQRHMAIVKLIYMIVNGLENETTSLEQQLEELVGLDMKQCIIKYFTEGGIDGSVDSSSTRYPIQMTGFQGSKGLSADYVFIFGLNNGELPRDPQCIRDSEICELIVGLTRTKKECYVMPICHVGERRCQKSVLLSWVDSKRVSKCQLNIKDVRDILKKNGISDKGDIFEKP
ncbi:MAG: UvrD-helicase domain-containing protein [Sphaerochaetaceae bacterium]|nr:UvrD-helicase domain-containing protein [Sphaerochaetaceae bacterium]